MVGLLGAMTGLDRIFPKSSIASYRLTAFNYDHEQDAPQPMGTFLLFRREALASAGSEKAPFDEQFPIFFNEVDLLYRLNKKGWPCLYAPSVRILHHGGESTRQVRKSMIWESHRSLGRFLAKHNLRGGGLVGRLVLSATAWVRARGYHAGFRA